MATSSSRKGRIKKLPAIIAPKISILTKRGIEKCTAISWRPLLRLFLTATGMGEPAILDIQGVTLIHLTEHILLAENTGEVEEEPTPDHFANLGNLAEWGSQRSTLEDLFHSEEPCVILRLKDSQVLLWANARGLFGKKTW